MKVIRGPEELEAFESPPCTAAPDALLSRLKGGGSDDDWREFFEIYRAIVFKVARRRGFSVPDSDDIVQETMVAVTREILSFQYQPERCRFDSWLIGVARSKIADHFRRQEIAGRLNVRAGAWKNANSLEVNWENDWRSRLLETALSRVRKVAPPKAFELFNMCFVLGEGPDKTARLFGVSLNSVYLATFKVKELIKVEVERLKGSGF